MREPDIGTYINADGDRHALVVRETADGGWRVLDVDVASDTAHIVDTLTGESDGRPAGRGDRPRLPDEHRCLPTASGARAGRGHI